MQWWRTKPQLNAGEAVAVPTPTGIALFGNVRWWAWSPPSFLAWYRRGNILSTSPPSALLPVALRARLAHPFSR